MTIPMMLGKKAPSNDPRNLKFAKYLREGALPPLPPSVGWSNHVARWPMMGNDRIGNCTLVGLAHMVQCFTANASKEVILSDDQVIQGYIDVTKQEGAAYDPKTGANDNGCVETDVLNYWRKNGLGGHKIIAYVSIDPKNRTHVKRAVQLFGGVYTGVALPLSAQKQVSDNQPWTVEWPAGSKTLTGNSEPGSWGGHCIPIFDYDPTFLNSVTWGGTEKLSWNWWTWYADECFGIITTDWLQANGRSPSGFDINALMSDLSVVAS